MELLIVVGLTGVIAAIAVPMMSNTLGDYRLRGDARSLSNAVSLTKLRSAADFTQARLYVDTSNRTFQVQIFQKTPPPGSWVTEGGVTYLSQNVNFGFGVVGTPPPNNQPTIGQAAACLNNVGAAIGNTACILFNSRGIPIDSNATPTGSDAVYVTDNSAVYSVTVSVTGLISLWRTNPTATPNWALQ
jgi:hypothetical protein